MSRQAGGNAGGSGLTSDGELGAGESFVGSLAGNEGARRVDGLGSGSGREAERRHVFVYQVDFMNPIAMVEAVRKGGLLLRVGKDGMMVCVLGCRDARELQLLEGEVLAEQWRKHNRIVTETVAVSY